MVNAEFNWWLLVVGLVVGAGLTWLVLADLRRHENEVDAAELEPEAAWIAGRLAAAARPLSVEAVAAVLHAHREYLHMGPGELDAIRAASGSPEATATLPAAGPAPERAGGDGPDGNAADQSRGGTRPT
jgi:hypothetical protein